MKPMIHLYTLLLASVLILSACGSEEAKKVAPPSKPVVALKVYTITLHDRIEALGTARARESVIITARVAGMLEKVAFTDGQQVRKGDVIVTMDQDEALAQLATAKVQLAEHKRETKRLEALLARKAASRRDLDERRTLAALTASTINEIKARIDELTLRAPFDGRLGIRRVSPGALVQPGVIITTLDASDSIKLDFSVPSTLLNDLKPGTHIEARADALGSHVFKGSVTATDSRIDPLTRSMLLRAEIDNPEGMLIPGMLMRVTLLTNRREAVIVPEESITQKQKSHFLTIVTANGTAEIRAVQTGIRRDGVVEIKQGLRAGELVVVRGMGFVKQGQKLKVSKTWERIQSSQYSDTTGKPL